MSIEMLGPYELRGELGRGAMARVWRAWDPNLQREVAIKEPLFDPRLSQSIIDEMGRRFVGEGRTAARLSHPGIVTIYAADVYDGRPAIVMELIEGETLATRLRRGPLAPAETLAVLDQLLDAVGYAHTRGVVHRDIKPDNIFIDNFGRVKLGDFGIARVDGSVATMGTVAGAVLGTPGYMSPEQATGSTVDGRSDLFSVGVVGYEMLTGANPFGAGLGTDATTLIYRIVHEPAPDLPANASAGLPSDLRPAIMCALSKDPAGRPQTAEEFRAMLVGQVAPRTSFGATGTIPPVSRTPSHGPTSSTGNAPTGPTNQGGMPSWLPYALVAGVAAVVLGFVFLSALGDGGGGGSTAGGGSATASGGSSESGGGSETDTGSPYYLAVSDGKIAIFTNSSASPYEVTDVEVSDLGSASVSELNAHVPADSLDKAIALVSAYRDEAEAARQAEKEAEEKAKKEAEEKAKKEAEEKAKAEAEAAAAAAQAGSTAELTVLGADGSTRTATIHRQGTSERVFADSNSRYLNSNEVAALSDAERCIAWNEIIAASNGYAFKNSGLASYFGNCSWYTRNPGASSGGNLNDAGRANVELLQSYTDSWWKNLAAY